MSKIFISYAREDRREAAAIAEALMLDGFEVWWDDDLPVHRPYTDVIENEIKAASAVVAVWSEPAAASEWVRAEANAGREAKKLVQVRLDHAPLPLPFNLIQFADLSDWSGDRTHPEWIKVLHSLSELMNKPLPKAGTEALAIHRRFLKPRFKPGPLAFAVIGVAVMILAFATFLTWRASAEREALARQVVSETLNPNATSGARAPVGGVRFKADPNAHPSYDCAKATTETEWYICSDPGVAAAEHAMADAYWAAMKRVADPSKLRADQKAFDLRVYEVPKERETLMALYHERTSDLKGLPAGKRVAKAPVESSKPAL